ncbi:hypothetical protein DFJ77DRAFT_189178 [Powellomyces hirtus]|nr:hypothetical protein DFJ77DRAFT_189178 [Powellomyces hirtus]
MNSLPPPPPPSSFFLYTPSGPPCAGSQRGLHIFQVGAPVRISWLESSPPAGMSPYVNRVPYIEAALSLAAHSPRQEPPPRNRMPYPCGARGRPHPAGLPIVRTDWRHPPPPLPSPTCSSPHQVGAPACSSWDPGDRQRLRQECLHTTTEFIHRRGLIAGRPLSAKKTSRIEPSCPCGDGLLSTHPSSHLDAALSLAAHSLPRKPPASNPRVRAATASSPPIRVRI